MTTKTLFISPDYIHERIFLDDDNRDYELACNNNNNSAMRKVLFDYYDPNTAKDAAKQISWGKSAIDDVRDYDKFNDVPYGC